MARFFLLSSLYVTYTIYHLMNRGDRREPIFKDDADRARFPETLGQRICVKSLDRPLLLTKALLGSAVLAGVLSELFLEPWPSVSSPPGNPLANCPQQFSESYATDRQALMRDESTYV